MPRTKTKDAGDVLRLLAQAIEAATSAKDSGTNVAVALAGPLQEFEKSLKALEPREALRVLYKYGAGLLARNAAPYHVFPTKKVRFNVFPQSEEKLELVRQAGGIKTKKGSIDAVLESLLEKLPLDYWERKSEVTELLSGHLPQPGSARPVSLHMNSLGYAIIQDLSDIVGESQGAILEAAADMWLHDLSIRKANAQKASEVLSEFLSHAYDVEQRIKEIEGDGPISSRFVFALMAIEDLISTIEANIKYDVPIDPDNYAQQGHEI